MKKVKKIRVVKFPAEGEPSLTEIDDTLEAMQGIVGGLIEYVIIGGSRALVVNEEGLINGSPANKWFRQWNIHGDCFVTRLNRARSNHIDLTDGDIAMYMP